MPVEKSESKYQRILAESDVRAGDRTRASVDDEAVLLVVFSLNGGYYAFCGGDVREILTVGEIVQVPGFADCFHGVTIVRGEVESVANLHKVLGLPNPEITASSRISIVWRHEVQTGVLVDSVDDMLSITKTSISPIISMFNARISRFATGHVCYREKIVAIMDVQEIFRHLETD